MTTTQIKIIAYLKPHCGWSRGVRAIFDKYKLNYEDRDIINDPAQREEMIQKSNQTLSPCVEVNGVMLPDISGEELEQYLLAQSLVQHSAADTDVPLDRGCPGHGAPLSDVGEIQTTLSPRKG
jgi:monothiol glutaredoxin